MRKILLLLFIVGSLLVVNTTIVSACSCASPAPPKESLESSTAVFLGRVIDIDKDFGGYGYNVKFEVEKYWKGISNKRVIVETGFGGDDCGYGFERGEEYLVYAYGDDTLGTGSCSRTSKLEYAQEDLQELGPGIIPSQTNDNVESNNLPSQTNDNVESNNLMLVISVIGGVLLIGIIIYFLRKHKK